MVILVPEVHDTEGLGGLGGLYHHHVALGVVGLDGHTEVVAWLVFVLHLKRRLYGSLLLTSLLPRNSSVSSGSSPLGLRLPGRCMRRKMALTWATPSSSLSATGTRIVSSIVYVFGSVGLAGKLILPHR
jgi:hypothetical protein